MSHDQSFLAPEAAEYAHSLIALPFPAVMERMERDIARDGQPAVGRLTGSTLRTLVCATPAKRVLEVGTNVGYSTLWLAGGLAEGGVVETIEIDAGIAREAEANAKEAGVAGRVRVNVGAALDVLPRLDGPFDLAFLDAVKAEYPKYLDLALPKLAPRGIVCADNAFWLGQAWSGAKDEQTRGIREYTRRVTTDPRLATTLVPSEDGLLVSVLRALV